MTADLLAVVREAGGSLNFDFLRYLVTRFEPHDGPQTQIVGFLRSCSATGADRAYGEIDCSVGRRLDQANALRSGTREFQPRHL